MRTAFIAYVAWVVAVCSAAAGGDTNAPATRVSSSDTRITITNTFGQIFPNAKITEVRPDGIKVLHSKGVALIPFRELPNEMRTKYGYDPEKEKEFRKEQARQAAVSAEQRRNQVIADTVAASGRPSVLEIIQIADDGALAKGYWITKEEYEETEYRTVTKIVGLGGSLIDNTVTKRVPVKTEKKTRVNEHPFPEKIFVVGVPEHLVDGDPYRTVLYPCGRYQYTTVMGGQATVERYATTVSEARRLLEF